MLCTLLAAPFHLSRALIVSYEMVKKLGARAAPFKTVIVDESHHLRVSGPRTGLPIVI
jgi:hypothetical protein